jgi:enoyl-CoA hydratase
LDSKKGNNMNLVKTNISNRVAIVTLNDPKQRNALSLAMAEEIESTLDSLEASPEVGAVVLTGTPPAFSAGANLDELENATRDSLRRIYEGFLAVARCPLPTVAAVNGPAVGAGLNLALACDVRVAARGARFESRFLDLALHPGGGHTWMLQRLIGLQGAAAMVLCGESLDGEAAARRGLAWSCVDDDALLDEAVRLAARPAAVPRALVQQLKSTLRVVSRSPQRADAIECELKWQVWSMEQPEFRDRIAAVKQRMAKWKSKA